MPIRLHDVVTRNQPKCPPGVNLWVDMPFDLIRVKDDDGKQLGIITRKTVDDCSGDIFDEQGNIRFSAIAFDEDLR